MNTDNSSQPENREDEEEHIEKRNLAIVMIAGFLLLGVCLFIYFRSVHYKSQITISASATSEGQTKQTSSTIAETENVQNTVENTFVEETKPQNTAAVDKTESAGMTETVYFENKNNGLAASTETSFVKSDTEQPVIPSLTSEGVTTDADKNGASAKTQTSMPTEMTISAEVTASETALAEISTKSSSSEMNSTSMSVQDEVSSVTVVPTEVSTATAVPTEVPSATAVPTEVPSATAVPTEVPSATAVPTEVPSATAVPTEVPSATAVPTEVPSATAVPTEVPSATIVPTEVPSATAVPTEVPSATAVPTEVPSATEISTEVPSATAAPTEMSSATMVSVALETTKTDIEATAGMMDTKVPEVTEVPVSIKTKPTQINVSIISEKTSEPLKEIPTDTPVSVSTATVAPTETIQPTSLAEEFGGIKEECQLKTTFKIGDKIISSAKKLNGLYSKPELAAKNLVGIINSNSAMLIKDGPICTEKSIFWYVQSVEDPSVQGWTLEKEVEGNSYFASADK